MELSDKYDILGILCLLTAFPLGAYYKPLIFISFLSCGIFILLSWFISNSEFKQELKNIERKEKERMLQENEEYYQRMQNL